ncbi:MAG: putative transcriptional regulator [Thermoleophilia bacterium]|nr:putative transcriptional regulator [Thermoleophilia bacterium]
MERADLSIDAASLQESSTDESARIVLRALRGEDLEPFQELVESADADALKDLAASEHGLAWSQVPRHLVPDDHRLATLHAAARMYRYDGSATHLDGDLFETMLACLHADDATWAEQAARAWVNIVLHTGEAATVWPHASTLLDRFPDLLFDHPGLLANFATLASTCGAPGAGALWDRILLHPTLGDNAMRRWEVELDWARCHLQLAAGEPARAMKVLQRARKGFADLATASAHLRWTDATLELVCGLSWLGRYDDALAIVEDSLRTVEPGGELELWLRAAAGYPAAALGDPLAVHDAAAAMRQAATDTSIMQLRAPYPARLITAMQHGDRDEVRRIVLEAVALETGGPLDFEARLNWRIHALEAAFVTGEPALAHQLLDDVDSMLDSAGFDLPVHRIRRDRVVRALDGTLPGAPGEDPLTDEALRRGASMPALVAGGATFGSSIAADHVMNVQLFGAFDVRIDGASIPDRTWSGRRQARVLLGLLLVHGNRLDLDTVAELLWGDVDGHTARGRISPLCASIRAVLAEAGDAQPSRELVTRGGSITLRLHDGDRTDLDDLRDAADRVRREPARTRALARSMLDVATSRPVANLGTERAAAELRAAIDLEVARLVPVLASAWDGRPAPRSVVDAVRRIVDRDPTDGDACARLMRLLRDRDDAPGASEAYHCFRTTLQDELGLDPPASVTQLHTDIITA